MHDLPEEFAFVNRMKKYEGNPILRPQGRYAADQIFNPAAVVLKDKVGILCRCINLADRPEGGNWSVSSLVWAWSEDGVRFAPDEEALLYPDRDSVYQGGFEDPRLVYVPEEGLWVLTYTGVRAPVEGGTPGLIALSKDLKNWEFLGEAFPARAIAIVNRKIGGKYWAYYGNSSLYSAWSYDLRAWHVTERVVISPREGKFDSLLCEAAAAPLVSERGIFLIYNGAMTAEQKMREARSPAYRLEINEPLYSIGWALFDPEDPERCLLRADEAFLAPCEPYENFGLVGRTLFASGLVHFRGKYRLYYGCADTRIGVAVEE